VLGQLASDRFQRLREAGVRLGQPAFRVWATVSTLGVSEGRRSVMANLADATISLPSNFRKQSARMAPLATASSRLAAGSGANFSGSSALDDAIASWAAIRPSVGRQTTERTRQEVAAGMQRQLGRDLDTLAQPFP